MAESNGRIPAQEEQIAALKNALTLLESAREAEYRRISRELHDEVGQSLTSLLLQIKALQMEEMSAEAADGLNFLRTTVTDMLGNVRRLAQNLRPVVLENLGLVAAIEWYAEGLMEHADIDIACRLPRERLVISERIELAAYRIVQEGLTNILRHAKANNVVIHLNAYNGKLILSIRDDGCGMNTDNKRNGLGLSGMRERAMLLGGSLRILSGIGQGTQLIVELPLSEKGDAQ
ncbi:histidine kinase [Desulfitobacterium dehalogenans ATCC 51507]|uniref:Oxygen sensor histidine kinase NreB n=1 Tax=Desulfitobacterium dehalogenans (strain ATCC 51507 / DSM 9161 / JW/IU-DC1) TaxID=756499 RepID=I4A8U9_DESDJ|nr:sensor histidine kinase [Desulfitobacterium dehalogenans]AFM00384.1 histidine kinase [Desulfitobacterium dehalogenans ATCC 51507]